MRKLEKALAALMITVAVGGCGVRDKPSSVQPATKQDPPAQEEKQPNLPAAEKDTLKQEAQKAEAAQGPVSPEKKDSSGLVEEKKGKDWVRNDDGTAKGIDVVVKGYSNTGNGYSIYELKISNSTDRTLSIAPSYFAAKTKNGEIKVALRIPGVTADSQLLPGGHIDSYKIEFQATTENVDAVAMAQDDSPVAVAVPYYMDSHLDKDSGPAIPGGNVKADNFN